ncbi:MULTISPECIES: clan AA aspartic protease [Sulfolobaceae]|uniref:Clan AA aspartic protease n=1 Tax=Saccharolobus islandicus (strain M.14.25 / Kamchatka \|nr:MULTISPECIES: clan AA aspartic protease [Sulfolobus]ACP37791.1 conserved hypothetical protein [Sulfolobus islandicus M.14.25]QIW24497.1 clan AA aspartic protease [Sulfolobus sp. S-194]
MNLDLEVEGVTVKFKIDSGFDGECLVSYDIFRSLPGEELEGPPVRLSDGNMYATMMKMVKIKFLGKEIYAICIANSFINKNLIGEKLLERLQIILDYKNLQVKDP